MATDLEDCAVDKSVGRLHISIFKLLRKDNVLDRGLSTATNRRLETLRVQPSGW